MKTVLLYLIFGLLMFLVIASNNQTYNLAFSTLLGGSDGDVIRDIESDSSGNIYVAGTTRSPDFPTTPGAYDREFDSS